MRDYALDVDFLVLDCLRSKYKLHVVQLVYELLDIITYIYLNLNDFHLQLDNLNG